MAEEASAVENVQVVADATATDSAPVENQTPEVVESDQVRADREIAESLVDDPETDDDTPKKDEPVEETEEPEQPRGKDAESRKEQLNTEIRNLVQQRNQLRQEVERANAEVYQPATEQELQDQGMTPEMAAIEAMKQEREVERYNSQVAEAQLSLATQAQSALKDFPMFDATSPDYDAKLAARADAILGKNLIFDQNTGQVIGSHTEPYEIYQAFAEAIQSSAAAGQLKGQQATEQMLARSDESSSAGPAKETEEDFFLKGLLGEK